MTNELSEEVMVVVVVIVTEVPINGDVTPIIRSL